MNSKEQYGYYIRYLTLPARDIYNHNGPMCAILAAAPGHKPSWTPEYRALKEKLGNILIERYNNMVGYYSRL